MDCGVDELKERFLASEGKLLALVAERGDDGLESQVRANRLSRALRVDQVDLAVEEFEALVELAERGSASLPKILQTLTWAQNQIGNSLFTSAKADDGHAAEPEPEPELVPANGYQG
jgi:hypothetical protein